MNANVWSSRPRCPRCNKPLTEDLSPYVVTRELAILGPYHSACAAQVSAELRGRDGAGLQAGARRPDVGAS